MYKYRMNRPSYWVSLVICIALFSVLVYFGIRVQGELLVIILGIPRLHDIGRSGWYVLIPFAIEIVLVFGTALAGASLETVGIAGGLAVLLILGLAVWLGLIPGDLGENKWGNPPPDGITWGRQKRV